MRYGRFSLTYLVFLYNELRELYEFFYFLMVAVHNKQNRVPCDDDYPINH